MASLETVLFSPMREVVEDGIVRWKCDELAHQIEKLPQLFWDGGEPWSEANHWAHTKATGTVGGNIKTATSLMKHLAAYATWLEFLKLDWRHFPERVSERAVFRFRGELVSQRDRGSLSSSTATARMRAVIQFYRHARTYGFVDRNSPMWRDEQVLVRYFDPVGFERTLIRMISELSIPNRARPGLILEDGLRPLGREHSQALLNFTQEQGLDELHLMLSIGLLTGARIGTITTLGVANIEGALPDASMPGFFCIRVGPGTGVHTKFNVSGELLMPSFLIDALKRYSYSLSRLGRQALATEKNRRRLFLTTRGNPYEPSSFNRLMTDLRRRATSAQMHFMQNFKFHQTRCTYGSWLMELALQVTTQANAVAFVRDAMLHKDEATTLRYVRFIQQAPVKALVSNEFTAAFSGVVKRDWKQFDA